MQHSHHEESCHRTKQCGITGPFLVQKPMFFVRAQLPENRSIYQGFGHPMVLCLQEAGCDPLPLNFKGIPYWIQKHACWLCLFFLPVGCRETNDVFCGGNWYSHCPGNSREGQLHAWHYTCGAPFFNIFYVTYFFCIYISTRKV